MDMNSQIAAWGTLIGLISAAVASLLTLWWTKGTDARIKLIKAESDAHHRSQSDVIIQKDAMIAVKDAELAAKILLQKQLEERLARLEIAHEALRKAGHEDRNQWFNEQLKCAKESAEQKGMIAALQFQVAHLVELCLPIKPTKTPLDVTVKNDPAHPVPTIPQVST